MSQNLLIIGATGVIGKYITTAIIKAKSNFSKIAILTSSDTVTRKAADIQSLKDQGVEIRAGDLTSEQDVRKAYEGKCVFEKRKGRQKQRRCLQFHPSLS
jgi:uncharacterized protein YbjT (DUF2867 family)